MLHQPGFGMSLGLSALWPVYQCAFNVEKRY
jgi:hypothetical protein